MISLGPDVVPAAAVRDGIVDLDLDVAQELRRKLLDAGVLLAAGQGERALLMGSQSWTVTSDPAIVGSWVPGCACPKCFENRDAGVEWLQANPGSYVAFCEMEYTQVRRA